MKVPLFLLSCCASALLRAQAPNVQWMRTAGGFSQVSQGVTYRSAVNSTGHVYTAGWATDPDYGNGVVVAGQGGMLARYDSTGAIEWARGLGGSLHGGARVKALATTSNGDVWVVGTFMDPALTIDGFVLSNPSGDRCFLARFDGSGVAVDAVGWGGDTISACGVEDVCADAQDRVYVTGQSGAASMTIDGVVITNTAGGGQLYALAFDANGTLQWGAMSEAPGGAPRGRCIAVDAAGSTYVVGRAVGDLVVDGTTLAVGNLEKAVLVTFDNTGMMTHMEALAECWPMDVAVDNNGQAYVSGYFETPVIFNSDTLVPSAHDGFVAAFPGNGTCGWVVSVSGAQDNERCFSSALNAAQTELIVGGIFSFDAWFGPLHVQTGMSDVDGFIMHVDTAGTVNWVKDMTGNGQTLYAEAMYDQEDRIHTSGFMQATQIYLGEPVGVVSPTMGFLARFDEVVVGVQHLVQRDGVHLYPNPSNGTFTLDFPKQAHTIVVADAQGREVQRVAGLNALTSTFSIATAGVYSVSVLSDGGRWMQRVVVE